MKRVPFIALLLALAFIMAAPLAFANEDPLIVIPYIGGPNYYAAEGQEVIIRGRWGACNRGLTTAAPYKIAIEMEASLDGQPFLAIDPPARDYWSRPEIFDGDPGPCLIPTDTIWVTYWDYSLGQLSAGEYDVHFVYSMEKPFIDGGDYDGDGRMDVFSGVLQDNSITILVE